MSPADVPVAGSLIQESDRSRRSLLIAGAATLGAVVAQAIGSDPSEAATPTVKLGTTNSTTTQTTIRNTASSSSARAFTGQTTYTGTAASSVGVRGISAGRDGTGVYGVANRGASAYGVWGDSTAGYGVAGTGPVGIYGLSTVDGTAVLGSTGAGHSVVGITGDDGTGVAGIAGDTLTSYGIYGSAGPSGWAGYFEGDIFIGGTIFVPEVLLQVDHPDAPGERWYRRVAVGAFERVSVVSGNVRTDAHGRATVTVPALFARQHADFRYQLTVIGAVAGAHVSRELHGDQFTVQTSHPRVKVSWQVTGVQDDPSARANAFHASVEKRAGERGRFLEPAVYGKSASRGLGAQVRRRLGRLASRTTGKSVAQDE